MERSALILLVCSDGKRVYRARVKAALPLLFLALLACDPEAPKAKPTEPAPVASLAVALGMDAGELEPSVDPPPPAGDLKAELDAFTTVDACVAQRAAGDPVVGDALEAIGYDTLVRDACRLLDAAKSRDPKRCADVLASTLKTRCEAGAAELAGTPEACPFDVPSRPDRGRDAACLALATRDASLCDAALDRTARVTCAALATHDAAPCKKLPLRADQLRCARDEQRWAAVLPVADAPPRPGAAPSGKVTLTGDAGAFASDAFALDVSRGVVVLNQMDGARVMLGSMNKGGLGFVAPPPNAPKTLAFELMVPGDPKKAHLERVQLDVPGHSMIDVAGSKAGAFTVHVTRFEKRYGGAVELTLEGSLDQGVAVKAEVTTFVRDVVSSSAMLAAPRGGDPGGMR
jgi:hypothetical protein